MYIISVSTHSPHLPDTTVASSLASRLAAVTETCWLQDLVVVSHVVSGFSTTDSKFLSIVRRARMVSVGDNEIYTGSSLQGVIPYVQCAAAVFLSQVCS
jgi:hypothetical protein